NTVDMRKDTQVYQDAQTVYRNRQFPQSQHPWHRTYWTALRIFGGFVGQDTLIYNNCVSIHASRPTRKSRRTCTCPSQVGAVGPAVNPDSSMISEAGHRRESRSAAPATRATSPSTRAKRAASESRP